eukprot:m.13624 g.13624  ORF g.13624 m.13624 type:complete len:442 (-) comp4887_c0_seq1:85-1410(-)
MSEPLLCEEMTTKSSSSSALGCLCAITSLRSAGDRSWAFIVPVILTNAYPNSLAPTACLMAFQCLSSMLLSPGVSELFMVLGDNKNFSRRNTFILLMSVENIAVILGGAFLLSLGQISTNPIYTLTYWIAVFFMCMDAVISGVLTVVVEKDWVVLAAKSQLTTANGWIARLDLGTSVLSYTVMGRLLQTWHPKVLLCVLGVWHILVALGISFSVTKLFQIIPKLESQSDKATKDTGFSIQAFKQGWHDFSQLPPYVQKVMVAYCLLYFTVMSPSGMLTAWLTSKGVSTTTSAQFWAAAQLGGFVGTMIPQYLIPKIGCFSAALGTLAVQTAFVDLAVSGVMTGAAYTVIASISLSRVGLWSFDLCEREIVQENTTDISRALMLNCEKAVASAAYLAVLILSMVLSEKEDFWVIAFSSGVAVTVAMCLAISAFRDHQNSAAF